MLVQHRGGLGDSRAGRSTLAVAVRETPALALPQILKYVDRLKARGHPHELYLFGTGHSSFDVDERVRQLGVVLDYLSKTVPGVRRLDGVRETRAPERDLV